MSRERRQLIAQLATDLQPVRTPPSPLRMALLWWLVSWAFVVVVTLLFAPAREGGWSQLLTHGRFLAESLLGLIAALVIALFAFTDSVPGLARRAAFSVGLVLVVIWISSYVIGLEYPTLPISMQGKRADCFPETLLYSLLPATVGIWLCLRYYPLAPLRTAVLMTLSASMMPALFMQLACMYDAAHILSHHILPIPLLIGAVIALFPLALRLKPAHRR
jgi:hypothetical protein